MAEVVAWNLHDLGLGWGRTGGSGWIDWDDALSQRHTHDGQARCPVQLNLGVVKCVAVEYKL